jgi:hypothetical protein
MKSISILLITMTLFAGCKNNKKASLQELVDACAIGAAKGIVALSEEGVTFNLPDNFNKDSLKNRIIQECVEVMESDNL